jgi:amino acid adenylation domain-containing protein
LNKDLDIKCFKQAINATLDRHEILRTVFRENEEGEVRQWILSKEESRFEIGYKDYREKEVKQDEVERFIAEDSYKPFDLKNGPLLRAALLQIEDDQYVFYFNMHHIISDGWSMKVLYSDVFFYYEKFMDGHNRNLPSLKIQYKDYASWQLDQLEKKSFKVHRKYWLDKLSGQPGILNLPGSNLRPGVKTHKGRTVATYLNKDLAHRFKNFSLQRSGTLFMSLVSVLKAFLHREAGQDDVIIGTPVAGRNLLELENQIGFYVNTLALRTQIEEKDSLEEIYQNVKRTILDAYAHQIYPFDRLVEDLGQSRQTSRSAVFDILVVLQNTEENTKEISISESKVDDIVEIRKGTSIYDITFEFREHGDYIAFLVEYNIDLYEPAIIEKFIQHFKAFSSSALSSPAQQIGSLEYISVLEKVGLHLPDKQSINSISNNTIVNLFHEQVERSGLSTALRYGDENYSYGQLNRCANQVAHFLLEETNIKKEEKIGLLLNDGIYNIASRLGVLKAGGAYVILLPTADEDQLLSLIADFGIQTLIIEKEFIEQSNRLQWVSDTLKSYLCINTNDVKTEKEYRDNLMMSQELWDHVGRRADDQITRGGWISSYTGEAISEVEMEEYSMNAYNKLKEILHPGMRVLEIGCSSGITLTKIAPEVAFYYATDLSPVILSKTGEMVADKGFKNVKLKQLVAHEISGLEEKDFDLIIINSVIQHFHGHNYFLKVIRKGIDLLNEDGKIFIGDVMDINKKSEMLEDLEQFKLENRDKGYNTKTDFSADFFVAKGYFKDLIITEKYIVDVIISEKIRTIENELTKYRYDALLQIDKRRSKIATEERDIQQTKIKRQYDRTDLMKRSEINPEIDIAADQAATIISSFDNFEGRKSLLIRHSDVIGLFKMDSALFSYGNNNKWAISLHKAPSILEVYGTLLFGSELVLVPELTQNKELLLELLEKESITHLSIDAASVPDLLAAEKLFSKRSQFCSLIVDGEELIAAKLQKSVAYTLFRIINKREIINDSFPTFDRVLTAEEKHELLVTFNDTAVSYPENKTIVDLFEEQAAKTPDNIAVVSEGRALTYRALNNKSNQLAHYLRDNYDIQPDDLVGIKQTRSEWMIVSILAVLKSGGAYVPIDQRYPQERIDYITEDTRCKVCMDETELSKFKTTQERYPKIPVSSTVKSDNLVYVIYTSGSTGKPKGVMVKHYSFTNLILWYCGVLDLTDQDAVLLIAPVSFDLAQKNLFASLTKGGSVCLSEKVYGDYNFISETIRKNNITVINSAPSAFYPLLSKEINNNYQSIASLTKVVLGGEPINIKEILPWTKSVHYHATVINSYGPTECTDVVSYHIVNNNEWDVIEMIPIGKPVDNTELYILDEQKKLLGVGLTGEIHVGGVGVSRGYLNNEELTSEKFVQNPFKGKEFMYNTGDIGRWLPDGSIEFIGRKDYQVKIRGHRVELGEIEHALLNHEEITQAVVVAKENQSGEKELVGYIISPVAQSVSDLRAYLKQTLPVYMLPAYFVQLEKLPLNANGKIERKSLPDPEGLGLVSGVEYVAARNEIEERLIKIWEEVLQMENIGVNDNFFALGGHSIKAVRLSNEYQKRLAVSLSLEELFAHTSIASHATLINISTKEEFVQIETITPQSNYALSDAQRRLWIVSQSGNASVAYNMPGSIDLTGVYNIENFRKAIHETIDRHESLRTVFRKDESGEIRQWVLDREDLGFEIKYKDFGDDRNGYHKAAAFIGEDSFIPFDLEKGPLLRASLLKVKEGKYVFYFNMHHIICDGWSLSVLAKDVFTYYDAFNENREPALSPLKIQYKDYSAWQLALLGEEVFQKHKEYWIKSLQGELPSLDLPGTKLRPKVKTNNGRALQAYINGNLTGKLKEYSEENGGSLYMGMLAGWNILMYHYTNQKDIIIGTSVAGRSHADLEDQIGFYSNTLALRNHIETEESFQHFFRRIIDTTLKSLSHQMYPFIRLVEDLNFRSDPSRNAIFDVMLFLQNNGERVNRQELKVEEIDAITDIGYRASKFDINIALQEINDCVSLDVTFNPDVYDRGMVEGLIKHYKQLLNALLENPGEKISQIEYLSDKEKNDLLQFNNIEEIHNPGNKTIVDLFDEQVSKTPDNTALVFRDKKLTYTELDILSNQLAHYLVENYEIRPDDLIGVMLNRSEWSIVSILGILKAGAAYVPIDPQDPSSRKDFIISDASLKVLITEVNLIHDIGYYDGNTFAIDVEFDPDSYAADRLPVVSAPDNLAYVIYTSGSTGQPKGAMITARAVVDYFFGVLNKTNISECKSFGLVSTISADLGNTVIFTSLLIGAALHVIAKEDIINVNKIREFNLDCIKMTPSHWKAWQTEERFFTPNKCLILGGEPFSEDILNYVRLSNGNCEVYNHYGPTETTIGKLIKRVDKNQDAARVTLGRPIGNNKVYVLNPDQRLCSIGLPGEICISGVGLARGYLNQEELSGVKFVDNPFNAGEKLYKTGDLGKWLPNGEIEYLGRIDEQVKIRGYRIELGEIEYALLKLDVIDDAVVIVKGNQSNEKELVAYIVVKSEVNASVLTSMLRKLLPEYMIPASYVELEVIPLTLNGKVDKSSLPDPKTMGIISGVEYVAPRNEVEELITEIIAGILGKSKNQISVYDNFFDMGISSLGLMKLYASVNEKMASNLQAVSVFEFTTVSALAAYLTDGSQPGVAVLEKENIAAEMDDMIDLI